MPTEQQIINFIKKHDTYAKHLEIDILKACKDCGIAIMPLKKQHCNSDGSAHGGAIFSLVDMAFAAACVSDGTFWVNAQSSISYLRPGKKGPLKAEARPIKHGRTLNVFEVHVFDLEQKLIAYATITGCSTGISMKVE